MEIDRNVCKETDLQTGRQTGNRVGVKGEKSRVARYWVTLLCRKGLRRRSVCKRDWMRRGKC